jgi:ABC-type transport system substrate-binding protein
VNASELKIIFTLDGSNPYAENAGATQLSTFNKMVLGQLLTMTDSFELQPGLLKDWKWNSKDGSYELKLKDGIKFHDGTNVTSEDLEFTLLRGFFSKQRSFYEIYLGNIKGVEKIEPGTKYRSGLVEGIKITGPLTVKVTLKQPNPAFLYSLTVPYFSLSKKSELNEDLMTWKKWPIGAGEYFVASEDENKVTLKKKDPSHTGIDNIILYKKNVPNEKYDISLFPLDQKMQCQHSEEPASIFALFFTNQNELSANSNFRESIKYGINRSELIEGDTASKPAFEFLPSAFWRNDSSIQTPYNLEKARSLFLKVPEKLRNKTWKIPVFSFGEISKERLIYINRLKEQLARVGLKVEFYPSSEKFLSQKSSAESPFRFSSRVCSNVDPLLMFGSFKSRSPYQFDNSQKDTEYDKLFDKAAEATSKESRVSTLRQLSKYMLDHNFAIPLYENHETYYFNPLTIESLGKQTNSITLSIDEIKLK